MSSLRWVDGQAFASHYEWECVIAGFHSVALREEHAIESYNLYSNIPELRVWTNRLLDEWPVTTAVHLSQKRNHRAWIGHAACFLHHGAGMDSSIAAYWMLDQAGRQNANDCVMEGYHEWTTRNKNNLEKNKCLNQSGQLVFQF